MSRSSLCAAVFLAVLIAPGLSSQSRAGLFVTPIGGAPYQDWTIINYVDDNPDSGGRDYTGGHYTYYGHTGIDFGLANFAKMDAGVPVLAAAAGTVVVVDDGFFDRNTPETLSAHPDPPVNHIYIDHGNGLLTKYEHLMKGSLAVKVGDHVDAGQQIAMVGSSGNSSSPHLHFTVQSNGFVVDPYRDPTFWWQSPLPYAGTMHGALDYGITNTGPTNADLENRPADHSVFTQASGQVMYLWAMLHGIHAGDSLNYVFLRPDGTVYNSFHWSTSDLGFGSWVGAIGLPTKPDEGEWRRAVVTLNGSLIVDTNFVVVPEPGSLLLAGLAFMGFVACGWRRKR